MNPSVIILTGFMGTGKSEVGNLLAERLQYRFVDLDQVIEEHAGCSIPDLFEQEGEAGFRKRETRALLMEGGQPKQVLSCGGGVVVTPENLEWLKQQSGVVCLDATPETIVSRIGSDPNRPLLQGDDPLIRIQSLMEQRAPLYAQLPTHIDTDRLRPSEVADRILSELRRKG